MAEEAGRERTVHRLSRGPWGAVALALLVVFALVWAGCSKSRTDEESQQQAVEAGKAIGMKQAEMMRQGKMGMPKTGN